MYILYQIKRFFFIFQKESFLFFRGIIKERINKTKSVCDLFKKKGTPNLDNGIKLIIENKEYSFHTLKKDCKKAFYLNSPLLTIIKNHKISIFNNLLEIFNYLYEYKLKIGLEIEFYILNNQDKDIIKKLKKLLPNVEGIERERGNNQFEIKTKPYIDIKLLVNDYLNILSVLKEYSKINNLNLDFSSLPLDNDCGSSLQINVSLISEMKDKNIPSSKFFNENLFARVFENSELTESQLMLNCIAGLLKNINNNLLFFIKNKDSLKRFELENNIKIRNLNKFPAPTFISWGVNNRSACIRIPVPNNLNTEKYIDEDNKNRRIEYRIPSSDADIYLILIGIIIAIIEGIESNLKPEIEKTSFDVLRNNSSLESIQTDFEILNDTFSINEDLLFF